MKKICFVLTVSTGINYGSIFTNPRVRNDEDLKDYFSKDYDVSINYIRDKDSVDYLVVPNPFTPFDNENNLPIIQVPAKLFMTNDFEEIKNHIDNYFATN
ncbi:hypothetical protein SAMN04487821_10283 [Enterococcus malodoratus]|uniref:hypothetical protein n=1 Tax=Enterococcus malodoratus TaxID=71451 RepID=UPI0008D0970A|nr:hypothetical protein [Enterococcus malodoratus]SES73141.1 hypothetical protein SAMN04487821_10283 [Enterococcus malodoratus]